MTELSPLDLERRSTAEMVAGTLRVRLLAGEFAPGTPMRESGLAPQVGVSRATMREALQYLVHEGLLTYHMHRGMLVTDLSAADVSDIYTVRLVIELAAIASLAQPPRELEELARAVESGLAAVERDDVIAIVEADMRFHHELARLADSPRLESCHAEALGQLRLALNRLDRSKGDVLTQAREHRRILVLLSRGAHDEAAVLLRTHLESAREGLIGFLAQDRAAAVPAAASK